MLAVSSFFRQHAFHLAFLIKCQTSVCVELGAALHFCGVQYCGQMRRSCNIYMGIVARWSGCRNSTVLLYALEKTHKSFQVRRSGPLSVIYSYTAYAALRPYSVAAALCLLLITCRHAIVQSEVLAVASCQLQFLFDIEIEWVFFLLQRLIVASGRRMQFTLSAF